jgi:hypothetical protein
MSTGEGAVTAEIAVMNKHGIALAADSAVTVTSREPFAQGPKIRVSANKIFTLSKRHPVAVMIYDSAEIMGVPWEVVIKTYRLQLGNTQFPTLQGYVEDFLRYLGENHHFFPADLQTASVDGYLRAHLTTWVLDAVRSKAKEELDVGGTVLTEDCVKSISEDAIRDEHKRWLEAEPLPDLPPNRASQLEENYFALFSKIKADLFGKLPALSEAADKQLAEIALMLYTRVPPGFRTGNFAGATGVVFAGYGGEDIFPSFSEVIVDEVIGDHLIWWNHRQAAITRAEPATVCAFAQEDMAQTFMEGVDLRYQAFVEESFGELLKGYTDEIFRGLPKGQPSKRARKQIVEAREEMLASYRTKLGEERHRNFVKTVIDSVQSLPLDDLAEMAESLVNLTSLKRKVSMAQETVSGPIDVAVISAGDGFIWINRKHYFKPDRNPQFFANYYRER